MSLHLTRHDDGGFIGRVNLSQRDYRIVQGYSAFPQYSPPEWEVRNERDEVRFRTHSLLLALEWLDGEPE